MTCQGELHNYATAFAIDEGGVRSYYRGGYSGGPYHAADAFLAGACQAAVWAFEQGDEAWEIECDEPGPVFAWATGEQLTGRTSGRSAVTQAHRSFTSATAPAIRVAKGAGGRRSCIAGRQPFRPPPPPSPESRFDNSRSPSRRRTCESPLPLA
jgi:hypothetical protein